MRKITLLIATLVLNTTVLAATSLKVETAAAFTEKSTTAKNATIVYGGQDISRYALMDINTHASRIYQHNLIG